MRRIFHIIIDILSPSRCICCDKPVSISQNYLCIECGEKIEFITEKCPVCSGIISSGKCGICSDRKLFFKKNIAIAEYSGIIKEILHNLKFSRNRQLYIHLGKLLLDRFQMCRIEADIVTSVPMNRKKKWGRGYNQSELIARYLAKKSQLPYYSLLKEGKKAKTQKDLGLKNRFINVINRYEAIRRDKILNKKILIVDDILTTGATINECARILLLAGANKIFSLTIARSGIKKLEIK